MQNEVKKLEQKGVNKIFLLAHTGETGNDNEKYYNEFAKIGGIDVIIGGHDHFQVDKWTVSKRGEPVKIVSTGKSKENNFDEKLNIIGKLNLEFDDNGVLIKDKCHNKFQDISGLSESTKCRTNILYKLKRPTKAGNPLMGHSEAGNIVADAHLWYVNNHTKGEKADFAFVNAGTLRGNFDDKEISAEDIKSIVPFTTQVLIKTELTKKQIINTLNWCALSTTFTKVSPGIMQVSNMEYTVNPDLTVSDVHILNDDGSIKYDLDDFDDDKKFTAVYSDFLTTGVAGLKDLKKDCENDKSIEFFEASRQSGVLEYFSHCKHIKNYEQIRIKTL